MNKNADWLTAIVFIVASLGMALIVAAAATWDDEDVVFLACLAGLAAISEILDFGPFRNSRMSISVAFIFAAGTFSGLPGAIVVGCASAFADAIAHRKPFHKASFNFGTILACAAAYAGVLAAFSPAYDSSDWIALLASAFVAASAAYAVNAGLVTTVIALDTGDDPRTVWTNSFSWMVPHYILFGMLGVLTALAYDRWELPGLALFLVPIGMAWLALKQYSDGTARLNKQPSATA